MDLYSRDELDFPLDLVYETLRDNLPEIAQGLPNVKKIDVESREEEGSVVRIVNRWHGVGEIPKAVRTVIKPDMLSWIDRAAWNADDHTCHWDLEVMFFKDNIKCSGVNYYKVLGPDRTSIEITGNLDISVKGIRGVPRLLEKKLSSQIEKFLGKLITPNMGNVNKKLDEYLKARG